VLFYSIFPDGKHTDGSLRVDDRYVNAAKELGLGGADGVLVSPLRIVGSTGPTHSPPRPPSTRAGMYSHIKSLGRVAGGVADIPVGTSIESAAAERARADAPRPVASVDVRNTDAAMAAIRTTVTTVGRAKVAGFSSGVRSSSAHNHADSFQRRKVGGRRWRLCPDRGKGRAPASSLTYPLSPRPSFSPGRGQHRQRRQGHHAPRG
jgi:hypothetical protein